MRNHSIKFCLVVLVVLAAGPLNVSGREIAITDAFARSRNIRTEIAYGNTVGPKLVLPIVGNAAGQNGTFFKSAVTLMNFKGYGGGQTLQTQRIKVEYYTAGVSNVGATPTFFDLKFLGQHWDNFLAEFFTPAKTGIGTLVITAVDSQGNLDTGALIDAVTRIYTAQPTSTGCPVPGGSVSQAMSAFQPEDLEGPDETGYIYGLRQDPQFRTNLGIVNHDVVAHTFTVNIYKFNGQESVTFTRTVEAKSLSHQSIPAGDYGQSMVVEIYTDDGGFFWSSYGSSVDNATGDGWINKATF